MAQTWDNVPFGVPAMDAVQHPNPDMADAMDVNRDLVSRAMQALQTRIADERQKSVDQGLWDPAALGGFGAPTTAGLKQAAQAYVGGMSDSGALAPMAGIIRAYHGSPHSFDRFDLSKIGTGEGAQAYGHGLYFAGNEGVARGYRDKLTPGNDISALLNKHNGNADAALADLLNTRNGPSASDYDALLQYRKTGVVPPQGHMYEVNLNVEPNQLLDWDKPMAEQVAARNLPAGLGQSQEPAGSVLARAFRNDMHGGDVAGVDKASPPQVASSLVARGIPGIQYLDAGSRGAGEGTRNYVMFDPALIDILRKYAMPGMVAGGAAIPFGVPQQ